MALKDFERSIKSRIDDCDIIADLELSPETFEEIGRDFKKMAAGDIRGLLRAMDLYPLSCVAHMVFFRVYAETDDFWTPWSDSLGIYLDVSEQGRVGQKLRRILDSRNFSYDKDGMINITALDCQAGVQNRNLNGVFNILNGVDYQDLNSITYEVNGAKSYYVHKSVMRFAGNHRDKATRFFADVLDVMQSDGEADKEAETYRNRISKRHGIWREAVENETRSGKRTALIERVRPELTLSNQGKGLSIKMPQVPKSNEYASEARWKCGGKEVTVAYRRWSDYSEGTEEVWLTVEPKPDYDVELYDDIKDAALQVYKVYGTDQRDFLLFSSSGKLLSGAFLPEDGYVLILNGLSADLSNGLTYYEVELPREQSDLKAYYFAATAEDSSITVGKTVIAMQRKLSIKTTGSRFLFGEQPVGHDTPIYTEFPLLQGAEAECGYTFTISCREYKIKESFGINAYLHIRSGLQGKYGSYRIRIDDAGKYLDTLQFIYLPDIEYNDSGLCLWPDKHSLPETGFSYRTDSEATVETDAAVTGKGDWNASSTREPTRYIAGTVGIWINDAYRSYPWRKTVRHVVWRVFEDADALAADNERGTIVRENIDNVWFSIDASPSFFSFPAALRLVDNSGNIVQELDVSPGRNGVRSVTLGAFSDSAINIPRPASIDLVYSDHVSTVMSLVGEVYLPNLRYSYKEETDKAIVAWDASDRSVAPGTYRLLGVTNPDFVMAFDTGSSKRMKDPNRRGLTLGSPLDKGLYVVAVEEAEDDFFSAAGFEPPSINEHCLLKARVKEPLHDVLQDTLTGLSGSFDERTAKLICTIVHNYGNDESICDMLTVFCMDKLTDENRGKLLFWYDSYNISEKTREKLTKILKLVFFKIGSGDDPDFSAARLSKFNTTIQLLWSMRNGSMPAERIMQIRSRAEEDFNVFISEFEKQRDEQVKAVQISNSYTLKNVKVLGPENHFEVYRTHLESMYRKLDSHMKGLPEKFRHFVLSRKLKGSDDWKRSIGALFYYSAVCASLAAADTDAALVHNFHMVFEKHYANLYHVATRDLLIAETILLGG